MQTLSPPPFSQVDNNPGHGSFGRVTELFETHSKPLPSH